MLSIVIPYYTETKHEIFPLLSSINNQVGVNFNLIEILLVNDGNNNKIPQDFFSLFNNLNIKVVYMNKNMGPGVARQVGINNAKGQYIMFCDADDLLHNVAVLGLFFKEIEDYKPDIITSSWIEELIDSETNQYIYIPHEDEITWMHGKVFNANFLKSNNIEFAKDLRVHEDSYFLAIAFALTQNVRKVLATTYVWKYQPNSITRCNDAEYTFNSIPEFINAIDKSLRIIEKIASEQMQYKVVQFIIYNYFTLNQPHWIVQKKYLSEAEKIFCKMIKYYMHYFEKAPSDFIVGVYNQERLRYPNFIEIEPFSSWLNRVIGKKLILNNNDSKVNKKIKNKRM